MLSSATKFLLRFWFRHSMPDRLLSHPKDSQGVCTKSSFETETVCRKKHFFASPAPLQQIGRSLHSLLKCLVKNTVCFWVLAKTLPIWPHETATPWNHLPWGTLLPLAQPRHRVWTEEPVAQLGASDVKSLVRRGASQILTPRWVAYFGSYFCLLCFLLDLLDIELWDEALANASAALLGSTASFCDAA